MICKEREDCKKRCGEHEGRGKCITDRVGGTGSTSSDCNNRWSGPICSQFTPKIDCAALKKYHNVTKSGVYEIMPLPNSDLVVKVRCDMETNCGGWTLISSSFQCSSSCRTNTFADYVKGFGDPEMKDVWIGSFCHYHCQHEQECQGREKDRSKKDGWISWDTRSVGPPFGFVDRAEYRDPKWCESRSSSSSLPNDIRLPTSGWWFDEKSGFSTSNLNAPPSDCEAKTEFVEYVSVRKRFAWNGEPLREAFMWIRPTDFNC